MKVFVVWTGYEEVGGVFSTRDKGEAYINRHLANHNAFSLFKRTREAYSNIEMTLDVPEIDDD